MPASIGVASGTLFPWIGWAIWKARNRLVFDGFAASPEETLSSAIRLAREWSKDSKPETSGQIRNRRVELPTPNGATIVRLDAAWSGDGNVAGKIILQQQLVLVTLLAVSCTVHCDCI
ncbi:hypothetical protein F2Q68_00000085 [Brassica cretica]|uniref:Uncharacterized protein n=1 Tax=Brassica cretica TaxID=69181 RepID=A0A8S9J6Z3_BRACR|nr:hypothetical protein F2Q68_00000085 [Brassica cretica]